MAASEAAISTTTAATEPPPGAGVSAAIESRKSSTLSSEEPNGAPALVDVDVEGGRLPAQSGHRLHVAEERDEPAGPRVRADVADSDGEAGRRVQERRVVGERKVGLRHADGQLVESLRREGLDLLLRGREEDDAVGAVDARADRLHLLVDRRLGRVDGREAAQLVWGVCDSLRRACRPFPAAP